ncbi:MAG: glycoside hydrolase family 3 N-terminal domain-containing protein [Polyangiaceae bacterium]
MLKPTSFRRILTSRAGTLSLSAVSLLAANCTHPAPVGLGPGTPAAGSGATNVGGAGNAPGTTPAGGGASGAPASSIGGAVTVITDGGGGGAAPVTKVACADDPNQQQVLPYTPGYTIAAADKTAADNSVQAMSLTAKLNQLHGPNTSGFDDIFRTGDDGAIKGFQFRDGPRGVNLDPEKGSGNGYATSFPVAASRGATFDVDLEYKVGQAMGDELIAAGGTMLLGPTVNILRHPAWGRSQETYGEDSFLLGRMGTAFTVGVQQFAPACVKHYAANNIEKNRESDIAKMDEQTLQEVYARHYGMIIQDAGVACVMAAYNQVDSTGTAQKCTQSKHLLTDILRTEYGFQGMVLSDWWAMPGGQTAPQNTWASNAKEALEAGMDMELPWNLQFSQLATAGIEPAVTTAATRIVETKFRFHVNSTTGKPGLKAATTTFNAGSYSISNNDASIALAEQAAVEGSVLLKNDMAALPIKSTVKTVAVVGTQVAWSLQGTMASGTVNFASNARLGDLGSSRVNADPAKSISPCAGFQAQAPAGVTVVCGDGTAGAALAKTADFVVVVAGLTPEDEGEDYTIVPEDSDRDQSLALDGKHGGTAQNTFISGIATDNPGKPIAVVLEGGSVIDTSAWLSKVSALVMAWYPGQSGGAALGKLFFGKDKGTGTAVNFSGKLPITWPVALADEPAFSGNGGNANTTLMGYNIGYRWFDTQKKTPLFPFGFGLSYTSFAYSNLQVPCSTVTSKGVVKVQVDVQNTGTVDGDEVVFLFAAFPGSTVPNRVDGYKELKGFQRAHIAAGQKVRVTIPLRVSDLWYWDAASNSRKVAPGAVKLMVGGSSSADQLTLNDTVTVQ